jgi:hypothetical protein
MLRDYLAAQTLNNREVAQSIRLVSERFLRVAFPQDYAPGMMVGQFRGLCEARVGTPTEILDQADTAELRDLVQYSNRFHHDTNPA